MIIETIINNREQFKQGFGLLLSHPTTQILITSS